MALESLEHIIKSRTLRSRALRSAVLLLACATGAAQQAAPQAKAPEAAQTVRIEAEANTRPQGLAKDALLRSDFRTLVYAGNWQLGVESNRERSYQGGDDYFLAAYTKRLGSWTITPGARVSAKGVALPYAIVGKKAGAGTLTVTSAPGTDRFFVTRARYNGPHIDAGVGYKTTDWSKAKHGIEWIAGAHTKGEGAWIARSAAGPYVYVATLNHEEAGLLAFAKSDAKTHRTYGVLQGSFGSCDRMNGVFTTKAGFDTARSLADQLLHPTAPSTPSYLVAGGRYGMELGLLRSPVESYTQAQAGMRVARLGENVELYAGAGPRIVHKTASRHGTGLTVEAAAVFKETKAGKVAVELRAAQGITAGIRLLR